MKNIVVVGMGYVGIPVAVEFANAGFDVIGINRSRGKVDLINSGICPIKGDEPRLAELVEKTVKIGKLKASQDFSVCKNADAIIIAVQTPFDMKLKKPLYNELRSAVTDVGKNLKKEALVIVESTIAPTTMYKVVKPLLEKHSRLNAGKDFYLVHCPERVMPGRLLANIEEYDRAVGGIDTKSCEIAMELYKHIVKGKLYPTDCLTAEIVKTTENAYRDVQIAFANEFAIICETLGVDAYKTRELVNKCPFRDLHIPGAGVGGHCLPKDSWLLAYGVKGKYNPKLIKLARNINDTMPIHVFELVKKAVSQAGLNIKNSKIAVLGFAYLQNTDDTRNTPALPLIQKLKKSGAVVRVHDPFVERYEDIEITNDFKKAVKDANCIVIVTAHRDYRNINLMELKKLMATPVIVDGRNVFDKDMCNREGFIYTGVGKAI